MLLKNNDMGDQKLKNIRKVKETAHPGNSSGNKKLLKNI